MKSVYDFIVEPLNSRYDNSKSVGDSELILNTEISNYKYISREAIVKSIPIIGKTNIKVGDKVIVNHNIFRRWHDQYGVEKNSRSYIDENNYLAQPNQIFLYKQGSWLAQEGYCFVSPIESTNSLSIEKEKHLVGVVKYTDRTVQKGDLIGFTPNSKYEFIIEGKKLYRLLSQFITIKYEYQGDEKEYNPSWT
jgi:hypothetical protein